MKVSTENLIKGLNIGIIQLEPIRKDENYFTYENKEWSWQDGEEFSLNCHLEVYAKEDFSFETYIGNIVVTDMDSNVIELTEAQARILEREIISYIEIVTLQA